MSDFNGMAKVRCTEAYSGALNCICFIERYRNAEFEETIQRNMSNISFFGALFNDDISFILWVLGKKSLDRQESIEYSLKHTWWGEAFSGMYTRSEEIIKLTKATRASHIYLTPDQCNIVYKFRSLDVANITANMDF